MMDRRDKVLLGLNLRSLKGLEIGPLHKPIVRRVDGPVLYVDHADTDALRRKNADNPDVDVGKIVDVDAVWGSNRLGDCIGGVQVDYVVASHVIEHVPDLIGWLKEIEEALNDEGQLRLIVPDKRYTFDIFRRPTSLADVLTAHLSGARRPGLQQLVDYALNAIYAEGQVVWRNGISRADLENNNGIGSALDTANHYLTTQDYIDVHLWVFSPKDFARLFERAARSGLIHFRCIRWFDTDFWGTEFQVHLEKCGDAEACAASWADMAAQIAPSPLLAMVTEDGAVTSDAVTEVQAQLGALQAELDKANARLSATLESTAWKITAPLRKLVEAVRRR